MIENVINISVSAIRFVALGMNLIRLQLTSPRFLHSFYMRNTSKYRSLIYYYYSSPCALIIGKL